MRFYGDYLLRLRQLLQSATMAGMATEEDVSKYFSVHEYGRTTKYKVYIFGGWPSAALMFRPLIAGLVKMGYACVLFLPRSGIFTGRAPFECIRQTSPLLAEEVAHRIRVDKVIGVRSFAAFGISLGSVFAVDAAKRNAEFRRIVLFVPFGDFRAHYSKWQKHWLYGRLLDFMTKKKRPSAELLQAVSSQSSLAMLRGRQALVCYSSHDKVAHTATAVALARDMNNHGIDTDTVRVSGGHVRGIIGHVLFKKSYKRLIHKQ